MKNKILVLGKGFIGTRIKESLCCDSSDTRITSYRDALKVIQKFKPHTIINCIGHIGKNVDYCELDKDKTLLANSFVPVILAEVALRNNIKLVHVSSGCIYHYDYALDKPLTEERVPDFFSLFYSRTKIYSEAALSILARTYPVLILRIRIPLDNRPYVKNLLTKLTGFPGVIDLPNSVTYIPDFIEALKHLLSINACGIFNVVNKGGLRYPELLDVYKRYVPDFSYRVIDCKKLRLVRTNLLLSTRKLEHSGFAVRSIHDCLDECVRQYCGLLHTQRSRCGRKPRTGQSAATSGVPANHLWRGANKSGCKGGPV
ncbi:MAG: sugar nucleotide-binding protein [Candidatus Omnitrophota bacterium]|jgi:dTDP-4-dehydrorhamnose reductase